MNGALAGVSVDRGGARSEGLVGNNPLASAE